MKLEVKGPGEEKRLDTVRMVALPIGRSPVAQKVLSLIPLPNYVGAGTTNYQYITNEKVNQIVDSLRLDQSFGTRHHLFAFASARENFDSCVANLPGAINSGSQLQDFYAKLIRVGYDFTITPRLVNHITLGGNRINSYNSALKRRDRGPAI